MEQKGTGMKVTFYEVSIRGERVSTVDGKRKKESRH